ncbi:hypothetical protein [Taibaiella chishuiensis]|uniref:Uncharacterized protein n=1 Tax=Taibaiella chishuiensis TaxID=1434707 RepID=A0A2P8D9Q0_9BACT|nr:hypothetical protein [Taibaiella chishuiensis]PSK93949.1 hypothetical protein B0I18_10198 [Taibaiella chishuiensis]
MTQHYLNDGPRSAGVYEDLDFIKKKLHYPLRRRLLVPLLAWIVPLLALYGFSLARIWGAGDPADHRRYYMGVLPLIFTIITLAGLSRYGATLRFATLYTGLDRRRSRELIAAFLRAQQVAVITHPMSGDIFQIVSTPVSSRSGDMREVLVLIADEGRILLNSHFANNTLMMVPPARLRRHMEKALKNWIRDASPEVQHQKLSR